MPFSIKSSKAIRFLFTQNIWLFDSLFTPSQADIRNPLLYLLNETNINTNLPSLDVLVLHSILDQSLLFFQLHAQ